MTNDKQRERLYYLFQESKCPMHFLDNKQMLDTTDYLLANGIIVPPCKVGQTVYAEVLNRIEGFVITNFEFSVTPNGWSCGVTSSNGIYPMLFGFDSVGKTVFLSREEAENALNNVQNGNSCEGGVQG